MRLRDLRANARISSILLGAYFFGIVKGEQPLNSLRESGVRGREGDSKHPPYLWPARSASRLTKEKPAPRHQRENQLKEKPALPAARAERKAI